MTRVRIRVVRVEGSSRPWGVEYPGLFEVRDIRLVGGGFLFHGLEAAMQCAISVAVDGKGYWCGGGPESDVEE